MEEVEQKKEEEKNVLMLETAVAPQRFASSNVREKERKKEKGNNGTKENWQFESAKHSRYRTVSFHSFGWVH